MVGQRAVPTEDAGLTREVGALFLSFRGTVFILGEILILDLDGREPHGHGRKPGKWGVTCEEFDDIESAIARSSKLG